MRICAWCGKSMGATVAGLVTHGICKDCENLYFKDDDISILRSAQAAARSLDA